jgi:hypothetical protein
VLNAVGVKARGGGVDKRLYRALDRVLPHKESLEKHLVECLGELFDLDYDLLLYDVSSTYRGSRSRHRHAQLRSRSLSDYMHGQW